MPKNIESYYQEAGRAGRDGSPADCILLYSGQDVRINQYLITKGDEGKEPDPTLEAHNQELLKQMTFYATGNECLRRRLLAYFGEEAPGYCGRCSNCLTEYEETDVTLEARKIISCVYRLKERGRTFGKTMIIDILRGGKSEKIKRFGLDSLSVWGIMADTNARRIRAVLDFLIDDRCLAIEGDEYPVVVFGDDGGTRAEEVLKEERWLCMKLPKEQKPKLGTRGRKDKPLLGGRERSERESGAVIEAENTFSPLLFEKLKELRREIAAKEGVPAYIVFSDASLRDMCRKKPVTLVQFSAVNGVGSVKLEKYGEAFVAVIRE